MAFPFFSLAKGRRTAPLIYRRGGVIVRVEAVPEYGMATIWDADVLIWAASLIVDARNRAVPVSPRLGFMPHRFLRFAGRSTGRLGYERLRAALDRLQSTTVRTSLRHAPAGDRGTERLHRFSWIDEWTEMIGASGRSRGMEIVLAGLVLPRRPRRTLGAVHRSGIFCAERRHRALALPPGAQTWRARRCRLGLRVQDAP